MKQRNDGGPAFPQVMVTGPTGSFTCGWDGYGMGGMTLRDAFAIAALQGLLAKHAGDLLPLQFDIAAAGAYRYADAMLAERAK